MNHLEFGAEIQIGDDVQGTVAADVAAVSVAGLAHQSTRPQYALIHIVKRGGTGDVTLPAPVKVVGTCRGRRVVLGNLNLGAAIAVGDDGGYQSILFGLGLCDAIVIIPGGALGGAGVPAYDAFVTAVWERSL